MACEPNYTFSIDGHNLTIIEVDGVSTKPLVVNQIQIYAGQRYSFILDANQPVDNYWIRSNSSTFPSFAGGVNSAVLRYIGSNLTADPTTNQTTNVIPLVESNLVPLFDPAAPGTPEVGGADVLLHLDLGFNRSTLDFTINGTTFVPPSIPVLLQILSGKMAATDLLPSGSVYSLPPNKVIELSFSAVNAPGGPVSTLIHPRSKLMLMECSHSTHSIYTE
jgi:iron transport multicopper oxidase